MLIKKRQQARRDASYSSSNSESSDNNSDSNSEDDSVDDSVMLYQSHTGSYSFDDTYDPKFFFRGEDTRDAPRCESMSMSFDTYQDTYQDVYDDDEDRYANAENDDGYDIVVEMILRMMMVVEMILKLQVMNFQ